MCEFCEEQKIIEFFDGKITWHIREKGKGYDMYYANSKTGELGIIDISYCPICGRKLTGEENEERCEQKESIDKIEKLNDRHQSDCIKINQLNVVIDALVEKYARLREVNGL